MRDRDELDVLPAGTLLQGRYRVLSCLGSGAMGVVYEAENVVIQKRVALKCLRPDRAENERAVKRLLREARLAASIGHENVIQVTDFWELDDGLVFMVMEHLEGQTLLELLRQSGPQPLKRVIGIMVQLCDALSAAHETGVIHRDLKPENILLIPHSSNPDFVKVLDFGISKLVGSDSDGVDLATRDGGILGTPWYMAPEQMKGLADVDHRADIYALGVLLFELLVGRPPFAARSWPELSLQVCTQVPPTLCEARFGLTPEVEDLYQRMLAKDRDDRPASCFEVKRELESLGRHGAGTRPSGPEVVVTTDTSFGLNETVASEDSSSEIYFSERPSSMKSNLLSEVDSFIGRSVELEELAGYLVTGTTRVLTLMGPGGTGKTRLSQRFALLSLDEFEGGAWFCDLTDARECDEVVAAVGIALGVPLLHQDGVEQLGQVVASRGKTLIVLDNFEQVAEHAEATIARWSSQAPEARFLITSRRRLTIRGEQVMTLKPLSVEEGVRLFVHRARAVRPELELDRETVPLIAEIVERLEGMSLAIELCAPRLRMLSLEKLLDRLSERFKLLQGTTTNQRRKQATLRNAIDWSWELLEPWEQWGLLQCSVFRGGFTLDAAEAVLETGPWPNAPGVMDVMQSLVDQSMVRMREQTSEQPRFSMYESIREYAEEKLCMEGALCDAGGETVTGKATHAELRGRHATCFAAISDIEQLDADFLRGGTTQLKALRIELPNLIAAVDWTSMAGEPKSMLECLQVALHVVSQQGPFVGGVDLVTRALATTCLGVDERLSLLSEKADVLYLCGRNEEAREFARELLSLAQEHASARLVGRAKRILGNICRHAGEMKQARDFLKGALTESRKVGDLRTELAALQDLAITLCDMGEPRAAKGFAMEGLRMAESGGYRRFEAWMHMRLAQIYRTIGPPTAAQEHARSACELAEILGDPYVESSALNSMGDVCMGQGQLEDAQQHFQAALRLARETGASRLEGVMLGELGYIFFRQGETDKAESYLEGGVEIGLGTGTAGVPLASLALVRAAREDFKEAHALLERAENRMRGVHLTQFGIAVCKRGEVCFMQGDLAGATRALDEAEGLLHEVGVETGSHLSRFVHDLRSMIVGQKGAK